MQETISYVNIACTLSFVAIPFLIGIGYAAKKYGIGGELDQIKRKEQLIRLGVAKNRARFRGNKLAEENIEALKKQIE